MFVEERSRREWKEGNGLTNQSMDFYRSDCYYLFFLTRSDCYYVMGFLSKKKNYVMGLFDHGQKFEFYVSFFFNFFPYL